MRCPRLGRKSKLADVLLGLLALEDPLPTEADVLRLFGAKRRHIDTLAAAGLVLRTAGEVLVVPAGGEIGIEEKYVGLLRPAAAAGTRY